MVNTHINVMAAATDQIPLPEGISKYSPFATDEIHPLSNDSGSLYLLVHPCYGIRSLEYLMYKTMKTVENKMKTLFGIEEINHIITFKKESGEMAEFQLSPIFLGSYIGIMSPLLGTNIPKMYNLLFPNQNYPIAFTPLNIEAAIFGQYVPVLKTNNYMQQLIPLTKFVVEQEMYKRLTYAVFPFIDQTVESLPILKMEKDSSIYNKIQKALMLQNNNNKVINLNWNDITRQFRNVLQASVDNRNDFFFNVDNPVTQLLNHLETQPSLTSIAHAQVMLNSQSTKYQKLDILSNNDCLFFSKPDISFEERKQRKYDLQKRADLQNEMENEEKILKEVFNNNNN